MVQISRIEDFKIPPKCVALLDAVLVSIFHETNLLTFRQHHSNGKPAFF